MPLTRFEITSRVPYAGGRRFGAVGAYEQVDGAAHFAVDPNHPANAADLRPEAGAAQWGGAGRVRSRLLRGAAGGRETGERPLHRRAAEPRPAPRRRHDELRAARCPRGTAGASGRRVPVRPRLHGRLRRLAMGRLPEPGADGPRRAFGHGGRQADRRGDDRRDPTERAWDDAPARRPHPPAAPGRARGAARRAPPRARLGGRRGHADTALQLALRARDPGRRRGAVGRARVARGRLRAGAHLSARLRDRPGARGGPRPPRRTRRGGVPAHAFAHQSMRQRASHAHPLRHLADGPHAAALPEPRPQPLRGRQPRLRRLPRARRRRTAGRLQSSLRAALQPDDTVVGPRLSVCRRGDVRPADRAHGRAPRPTRHDRRSAEDRLDRQRRRVLAGRCRARAHRHDGAARPARASFDPKIPVRRCAAHAGLPRPVAHEPWNRHDRPLSAQRARLPAACIARR